MHRSHTHSTFNHYVVTTLPNRLPTSKPISTLPSPHLHSSFWHPSRVPSPYPPLSPTSYSGSVSYLILGIGPHAACTRPSHRTPHNSSPDFLPSPLFFLFRFIFLLDNQNLLFFVFIFSFLFSFFLKFCLLFQRLQELRFFF